MTAIRADAPSKTQETASTAGIAAAIGSGIAEAAPIAEITTIDTPTPIQTLEDDMRGKITDEKLIQLLSSPTGFGGEHAPQTIGAIAAIEPRIDSGIDSAIAAPIASAAIEADAAISDILIGAAPIAIAIAIETDDDAIDSAAIEPIDIAAAPISAIAEPIIAKSIIANSGISDAGRILT